MSLIVSGNIVVDLIVRPVDAVRWGASVWVESMTRSIGGNGANTAYAAAKHGARVRLLGAAGTDDAGDWVLDQLRAAGVDASGVARVAGPTASTVALVRSDGERCFLHLPGASLEALAEPLRFVDGAHYHLAAPFAVPKQRGHLAESLAAARAAGMSTSLDTQWDSRGEWMSTLGPALPLIDLLFANEEEARQLTGTDGAAEAARRFGVRTLVLKQGAGGCAVIGDGVDFRDPAEDVTAIDTTGAGDVFVGAFLAEWLRSRDYALAARAANRAAGESVARPGVLS